MSQTICDEIDIYYLFILKYRQISSKDSSIFEKEARQMKHSYNEQAIRLALKAALKATIWAFNQHHFGHLPDLWLFGSRRSGSTLLMQMAGVNPGVKYCNQPLSVRSASPLDLELLQSFEEGSLIELIPETKAEILNYINALRSGDLHHNEPWRVWAPTFHWRSDRIVFKVTSGSGIADWICESLPAAPVILARHPIPQSLSCIRNHWHPRSQIYLQSDRFKEEFVKPGKVDDCLQIQNNGTQLQRHVLTWCCENVTLIRRLAEDPSCSFIPYEDLVVNTRTIVEEMSAAFALPAQAAMMRCISEPSISSGLSSPQIHNAIRRREMDSLVSGWRRQIHEQEEREAMAVLKLFDLAIYEAGEDSCRMKRRIAPTRDSGRLTS